MRCDSCNKFVSLDCEQDPDVNVEVDKDGCVSGTVTITNTCAECGQEMTSAEFTVEDDFSDDVTEHLKAAKSKDGHSLDVELDASRMDYYQDKDRRGKPIKSMRYQKHMYGAEGTIVVKCACGEEWSNSWSDAVQASGMDSLQ